MKKAIVLLLLAAGLLGEAFGLVAVGRGQEPTAMSQQPFVSYSTGTILTPVVSLGGSTRDSNGCYGMFQYEPARKVCVMHIFFMPPPSKVSCTLRDSNAEENKMGYMQTIDCTAAPEGQHK